MAGRTAFLCFLIEKKKLQKKNKFSCIPKAKKKTKTQTSIRDANVKFSRFLEIRDARQKDSAQNGIKEPGGERRP